jgi:rhodanese-related sulfurtransferase
MADGAGLGVDGFLAAARARIERLEPDAAWAAASTGDATIVDIRSDDDRRATGVVPGSLHIPRTVLEWRVDPASEWHNPHVGGRERRLVVVCSHGFSSSLAAATLVDLGFARAGDVVGGFEAWIGMRLPVAPAPRPRDGLLPGMGPPEPRPELPCQGGAGGLPLLTD